MKPLSPVFILFFFFMFFSAGCTGGNSIEADGKSEKPFKIGILLPLTGKHAKFGEIEKLSFKMAQEELNKTGGVNGGKIKFIFEDTLGKPDVGRSGAEKLITVDGVALLGGGYSSSVTAAVTGIAISKNFPFLVNTGSADVITEPTAYTPSGRKGMRLRKKLTQTDDPVKRKELENKVNLLFDKAKKEAEPIEKRFAVYRINPPVSEYSTGLEQFLETVVKPKSVAIIYENSLFGTKGAEAFVRSSRRLKIKVLLKESYDAGAIDFKPLLSKIKSLNPDLVYMISYVLDASMIMNQSAQTGLAPKLFAGAAAGFTLPEFYQSSKSAAEKVVSATLWHKSLPYPGAKEYSEKFNKKYGRKTDYHGAEAYSAAYVMADVLKRARSTDPADIRRALDATDMMTVFGPVKFVKYGRKIHQNRLPTYVVQWIEGELELVWPEELAGKKAVYPVDWIAERKK